MPIIYEEDDSIGPMKPSSLFPSREALNPSLVSSPEEARGSVASSADHRHGDSGYLAMACDMSTEIKRVEKDVVLIKYLLVGLLAFEGLRSMYSLFGYF